ncbi:MAG TPA: GtrA family protein [Blastocatellia bacterium]
MFQLRNSGLRWIKFSAVGAIGIGVQSVTLLFLVHVAGVGYLTATAIAVEMAIIHNFQWHHRWTWVDRTHGDASLGTISRWAKLRRFIRFNLTTGAISIAGNLGWMRLLAGSARLSLIHANFAAIALCGLMNFLVADRFVFL